MSETHEQLQVAAEPNAVAFPDADRCKSEPHDYGLAYLVALATRGGTTVRVNPARAGLLDVAETCQRCGTTRFTTFRVHVVGVHYAHREPAEASPGPPGAPQETRGA